MSRHVSKYKSIAQYANDPKTMDIICVHVSSGGLVLDLCKLWGVSYGHLTTWIHADKERRQRFSEAYNSRTEFIKDSMLRQLIDICNMDIRELYDDQGRIKPTSDWPDHVANAVQSVETTELFQDTDEGKELVGYKKKVRLESKQKAVELLGKLHSLLTERREVIGVLTVEDLVLGSMKKKEEIIDGSN